MSSIEVAWRFLTTEASLGDGGFGDVYPCDRLENGRVVKGEFAVKLCRIPEGADPDEWKRRFTEGGRLGKKLRHPNILPVLAAGNRERDGTPFIVMPKADGNLLAWMERGLSVDEATDAFSKILAGIAYAHSQQILHRDIKPHNVLTIGNEPVVSDFDLAKDISPRLFTAGLTETAAGIGSRGYTAPEQWEDLKRVGPPADVYALGRLFWSMLSGIELMTLAPVDLLAVPAQYRAFIERATEQREDDRYGSATEMLRALEALIAAPPGSPKKAAQDLIERWNDLGDRNHSSLLRDIDEHFRRFRDDDDLHSDVAPFLPPGLITAWANERALGFAKLVAAVDDACSGPLLWDDCDGFARFYLQVFTTSTDPDLRTAAIEQVLRIGASHNRYPVATMLRNALDDIEDEADAALVAAAVDASPEYSRWFHVRTTFHPVIIEAFSRADSAAA